MYIKKGDNIIVLAGKDKGKKGKVQEVFPRAHRVIVEGLNMVKRHQRARKAGQKGQIISVAQPLHVSNVALVDPKKGGPTRISLKRVDGKMTRIAKKSGTEI